MSEPPAGQRSSARRRVLLGAVVTLSLATTLSAFVAGRASGQGPALTQAGESAAAASATQPTPAPPATEPAPPPTTTASTAPPTTAPPVTVTIPVYVPVTTPPPPPVTVYVPVAPPEPSPPVTRPVSDFWPPGPMTYDIYQSMVSGSTTLDEAIAVLGPGDVHSSTTPYPSGGGTFTTTSITWNGDKDWSYAILVFTDGILGSKSEHGL